MNVIIIHVAYTRIHHVYENQILKQGAHGNIITIKNVNGTKLIVRTINNEGKNMSLVTLFHLFNNAECITRVDRYD